MLTSTQNWKPFIFYLLILCCFFALAENYSSLLQLFVRVRVFESEAKVFEKTFFFYLLILLCCFFALIEIYSSLLHCDGEERSPKNVASSCLTNCIRALPSLSLHVLILTSCNISFLSRFLVSLFLTRFRIRVILTRTWNTSIVCGFVCESSYWSYSLHKTSSECYVFSRNR